MSEEESTTPDLAEVVTGLFEAAERVDCRSPSSALGDVLAAPPQLAPQLTDVHVGIVLSVLCPSARP
jgi:hypothetical protein